MLKSRTDRSSPFSSNLSNFSLDSIEQEETEPWHGLLQKLSEFHLESLHARFKENRYKYNKKFDEGLSKEEFVEAIDEVFGNCKYSLQATILYSQIDKEEKRRVTWNQFLDFFIENSAPKFDQPITLNMHKIFSPPHVKRETIAKIVLIETEKYFCYAVLSKFGRVGLYDGNMEFLTSYFTIMSREDIPRKDEERRRRNRWITEAVFMDDLFMFIITTSARSLTIYDASGLKHVPLWLIMGVPNIIQCFVYHGLDDQQTNNLFMGDDSGQLLTLHFLQPKNGLFRRKHNDKLSFFYWMVPELPNEKDYVIITSFGQIHRDGIRNIKFYPDNNTIASCSRDVNASVVIRHLENKRKGYIFKTKWGASYFDLSRLLKLVATGSDDGTIKLWNIVVTSKPIAILKGHQAGIVDIKILENQELLLSCSRDGILKLWSIKGERCVQTLRIKFPSFDILGKTIEWGTNALYAGPQRQQPDIELNENEEPIMQPIGNIWERSHIFVACCNYLAQINFAYNTTERNFNRPVLPPPPLQNSVLIPKNWKICDDSVSVPLSSNCDEKYEANVAQHLESLKFILDRDLLSESNLRSDINFRLATLENKKLQMKTSVARCAPYLALELQRVEEIKLSPDLPVPNGKK